MSYGDPSPPSSLRLPLTNSTPNFLSDAQTRIQSLERRIQELELDLRQLQVRSEREKMELREVVQHLQGDKAMLAQTIQKLEEDAGKPLPLDLPRQTSAASLEIPRQTAFLSQLSTKKDEIQRLRTSNELLLEQNRDLEGQLARFQRFQSEWSEEKTALKREITELKSWGSDLSVTTKPRITGEEAVLEKTASFNDSFSQDFCFTAPLQESSLQSPSKDSFSSLKFALEKAKIEIDRANLERDRALLELQETKSVLYQLSQERDEREGALQREVKYLIGKLLKAKGKQESLNETVRSFPKSGLTEREKRGSLAVLDRTGGQYSGVRGSMFGR